MKQIPASLRWLLDLGLQESDLSDLNPCIPGEFTMQHTYYVNTATPNIVYRGSEEGTLPPVSGRWYLLPAALIHRLPRLSTDTVPVARAVRLAR